MNKEIQHHGAQDKGFAPPRTIYNKQTAGDKEPLPAPEPTQATLSDAKDFVAMPSDLVGDIKFFLEQMCRYSLMLYGDRVKMANSLIERMDKIKKEKK